MRTAILIPGYLRFFKECHPNFKEYIVGAFEKYGEVDIFVHTWKNIPQEYFGLHQFRVEHGVEISHPELNVNEFIDLYKPTEIVVEDFLENKEKLKLKNFCNLEDVIDEVLAHSPKLWYDGILHTTGQYYKIYHTNRLKSAYEDKHGFKYDIVLKYRSDALCPGIIPVEEILKNVFYIVDGSDESKMIADSVWLSNSKKMDYTCNIYERFPEFYSKAKELKHKFTVETMLYLHLKESGFKFRSLAQNGLVGSKWKFYGRIK
jgi:hypothetical protein